MFIGRIGKRSPSVQSWSVRGEQAWCFFYRNNLFIAPSEIFWRIEFILSIEADGDALTDVGIPMPRDWHRILKRFYFNNDVERSNSFTFVTLN